MTLNFKNRYDNKSILSIGGVVQHEVSRASSMYDGTIEAMHSELDRLTEIVSAMSELLSDDAKRKLAGSFYGWEEVK